MAISEGLADAQANMVHAVPPSVALVQDMPAYLGLAEYPAFPEIMAVDARSKIYERTNQ